MSLSRNSCYNTNTNTNMNTSVYPFRLVTSRENKSLNSLKSQGTLFYSKNSHGISKLSLKVKETVIWNCRKNLY